MKNKYWIGIFYVCLFMSATGCHMDADANALSEDHIETMTVLSENNIETMTVLSEDNIENMVILPEDNIETTAALSNHPQEEYTEEYDDEEESIVLEGKAYTYTNPIDAYFLPHIENASCEAERRELQDTYRGVWKTEFENIMVWMQDKCVYQEDKDNLLLFADSVESLMEITCTVLETDWLDNYKKPPGSDRNAWGNGTRSGLNQKKAEIYRDASMKLIDDTYIFMERDYSLEHYE